MWNFSLHFKYGSNFWASKIRIIHNKINFILNTPYGSTNIIFPLLGYHNIENALAAASLSMSFNIPLSSVKSGLEKIKSIPGRLFPIYLSKYQLLIDDTYNSNFGSMIVAINFLSKMPGYRIIVIGDMAELGSQSKFYHDKIGKIIKKSGIDYVLTYGNFSYFINKNIEFGKHFINKNLIIDFLRKLLSIKTNITILVKGSRITKMEYIVNILKEDK